MGRASFYEYMTGDFASHLQVPVDFIENFNGKTPKRCTIRSALDKWRQEWEIEMASVNDNILFFGRGWEVFVEDNYVEKGNYLVFKYCGGSAFDVKIYGKNHCEIAPVQKKCDKDTACAGGSQQKTRNNFKGESSVYHEKDSDDKCNVARAETVKKMAENSAGCKGVSSVPKRDHFDLYSTPVEGVGKNINSSSRGPSNFSCRTNEAAVEAKTNDVSPYEEESDDEEGSDDEFTIARVQTMKKKAKYSAGCKGAPLEDVGKNITSSSRGHKEAAFEGKTKDVGASSEKTPSFKVVMSNTNLASYRSAYLHVPAEFRNGYLKEKTEDCMIMLMVGGSKERWPVKYHASRYRIGGGWIEFSRENRLDLHDECVFEIVEDMPNITLNVKIYRGLLSL